MSVRSLKNASIKTGGKSSKFWDQTTIYTPPAFESIATVSVGAGGVSSITFTSGGIWANYKHLQLRGIARDTWSAGGYGEFYIYPNSDTSTVYSDHGLYGNGSSAAAYGYGSRSDGMFLGNMVRGGSTANAFGAFVIDILDINSTSKYKTARCVSGSDLSGSGAALLQSALWQKTDAITSLYLTPNGVSFAQYTHMALYGIKD